MSRKTPLLCAALISLVVTARLAADCSPAVVVLVPATACKSGTATVGVLAVPGASYAWTVTGGQIAGDASGDRITIALGTGATASASVTMTSGTCVSKGSGVIALHDPFAIRVGAIQAGHAGEPLIVAWVYDNGSPAKQTVSTSDSGTAVTLGPDVRSYTYTPQTSGSNEFVIDAVMKTTSIAPPPVSRQRAVGKSPANASACSTAHASMPYTVGVCSNPPVAIDGPDSAISETAFSVSVRSQPGAVASWTITNGTPATATGDAVMVTAGSSGSVGLAVRFTRGACMSEAERSIAIVPKPACDNPKATVSSGPLSCGSAIVNATFTGTPPFQGVWSDGVHFETKDTAIARTFTIPGNYSILSFWDSVCLGSASGVAVVPALLPTARITSNGGKNCTYVDSVTVQFTGKPPFWACWTDGSCYQTNQMQTTKLLTAPGTNTIAWGYDGDGCAMTITGAVQASESWRVRLSSQCYWTPDGGNFVNLLVSVSTVMWSDGVITYGTRYGLQPAQTTTYTITSIQGGTLLCDPIFDTPRSVTVYPNPVPEFTPPPSDVCSGSTVPLSLATPPPPGTQVTWFVDKGAKILSGQGTNTIQYQAFSMTSCCSTADFGCTFKFADPNRCPLTKQGSLRTVPVDPYATMSVDTTGPIHAGKTGLIQYRVGDSLTSWSFDDSMGDAITPVGACSAPTGIPCYAQYTSTHGPGQSTITMHAKSACPTKDVSMVVTILP